MWTMPEPTGPHHVGCVDFLTPGGREDSLNGRLFYPTAMNPNDNLDRLPLYLTEFYLEGILNFYYVSY